MSKTPTQRRETAELEAKREERRIRQPYAAELDDRELERAHKEKRPFDPKGKATAGSANSR